MKNFLLLFATSSFAFRIGFSHGAMDIVQAVLTCGAFLTLFAITWLNMDHGDVKKEEPSTQVPTYSNFKGGE